LNSLDFPAKIQRFSETASQKEKKRKKRRKKGKKRKKKEKKRKRKKGRRRRKNGDTIPMLTMRSNRGIK